LEHQEPRQVGGVERGLPAQGGRTLSAKPRAGMDLPPACIVSFKKAGGSEGFYEGKFPRRGNLTSPRCTTHLVG